MIGKTISHYKILEELGRGGMGIVYMAEDTKLKRTVALKFLSPQTLGTDEEKARFIHEAQAAAALSHPNICTIYEIEEYEGQSFIAMEYVDGGSLRDRVQSGPLKLDSAIDISVQVAGGLQEAHEKGIVHRDIKPANLMITPKGQIKIMDFGLAKAQGQTMLTKADTTLGTFAYMSPEQTKAEDVDHRADIWSLGVVLYEMVTGQRPFRGDYEQAVVYYIMNEEPEPVTALRTGVPGDLERIIVKCCEKDPAERYQTAADLIADLRHLVRTMGRKDVPWREETVSRLPGQEVRRQRDTRRRYSWIGWVLAVIVLAFVISQVVPRFFPSGDESPRDEAFAARKMIVVLPFENLGPPEDAYFADGITEEITSRLAVVSGLGVISRTSAVQYDRTGKTLKQIGRDLGVDYVLEGTIRWNKGAAGGSRIRVTPQLIRVSDDTHLWAETYDRVMEDIFAVQSDVAEKIIEQLGITMLDSERKAVESKPTDNLLAYEAYLQGLTFRSRAGSKEEEWRLAVEHFERAVELDPTFALAYARLSGANGELYFWAYDRSEERLNRCKEAAERSLELQPELPEGHVAMSGYYYMGLMDYDRALEELFIAAKDLPNDAHVIENIAYIWRRKGLHEEAISYLEKAMVLDPERYWYPAMIGISYNLLRQYERARYFIDKSIAMEPDQHAAYYTKFFNILMSTGDLKAIMNLLESAPDRDHPVFRLLSFWTFMYERDYHGALAQLEDISFQTFRFQADYHPIGLLRGYAYEGLGDSARAVASFEAALAAMQTEVRTRPEDGAAQGAIGMVYAALGRRDEAISAGKRAMELHAHDLLQVAGREWELTQSCIRLGEHDAALDHIEHLLSIPSLVSARYLEITPMVDPLRDHPRFKKLLSKYSE
jgi:TolB-like protein/tRNA A-37 threonylcarbamoyl transferase component Bud32/Flp pilus assembly protein TadD